MAELVKNTIISNERCSQNAWSRSESVTKTTSRRDPIEVVENRIITNPKPWHTTNQTPMTTCKSGYGSEMTREIIATTIQIESSLEESATLSNMNANRRSCPFGTADSTIVDGIKLYLRRQEFQTNLELTRQCPKDSYGRIISKSHHDRLKAQASYGSQSSYGPQSSYGSNSYGSQSGYETQSSYGSQSSTGSQSGYEAQSKYGSQFHQGYQGYGSHSSSGSQSSFDSQSFGSQSSLASSEYGSTNHPMPVTQRYESKERRCFKKTLERSLPHSAFKTKLYKPHKRCSNIEY